MSLTPPNIGTLIVVVLKARNLPNKRHIGKQDPYCTVTLNGEKRRTQAIRRGGQHPEWDEEIRYTVYEDTDEELARMTDGDSPPPPPPKSNAKGKPPKIKGGHFLAIACYAEDPREPDLIGETKVDLTEVLTKGETDEWFTLMHKDKYCGEVYLELTFWSNEPAPAKKTTPKPNANKQYGGPGSFVPLSDSPAAHSELNGGSVSSRLSSTSSSRDELRRENLPPSLRSSISMQRLDLYVPPYESMRSHSSSVDGVINDFAELGVTDNEYRRQSLPPQTLGHSPRPSTSMGFSNHLPLSGQPSQEQHLGTYSDGNAPHTYDRPVTPNAPLPYPSSSSLNQESYQPQYESAQLPSSGQHSPARHTGPRYSIPPASSGFMPIPSPTPAPPPSGFLPLPTQTSQPSGFAPLPAPTPAPISYGPPQAHHPSSSFSSLPPASSAFANSAPPPPSSSYYQPIPQSSSGSGYNYAPYPPPSNPPSQPPPLVASAPLQHQHQAVPPQPYGHLSPPPSVPPQSRSASTDYHTGYIPTPSPPRNPIPPPPPLTETPAPMQGQNGIGSRPLPKPQPRRQTSLPVPPPGPPGPPPIYDPSYGNAGFPASTSYNQIPPPPPLPQQSALSQQYPPQHQVSVLGPPQPPHSQYYQQPLTSRPSLPPPPVNFPPQQSAYQSLPPPPAPPALPPHVPPPPEHTHVYQPAGNSQMFYPPGPPPRPPTQLNTHPSYPPAHAPQYGHQSPVAQTGWQ
ncbi:hypothetical protein OBBRIDRAFT_889196 [Obba rivulosa]|uniref:C2 domain-containing protein n=1 Tax=Obba rivulosa TaxID=1052685 RepID=A0A8E2DIK2_9APHY|nr:hypothetical protein OBBRIDRAFT_889196 [Obba rivulosa]